MDNSEARVVDVFFYGLYMDPAILKTKNVTPRNPRVAYATDYKLRIGKMATLLREKGAKAYGMVYALTHAEIHALYQGSGLDMYVSEALDVTLDSGATIPVLCSNLLTPPYDEESNPEYEAKLISCMQRLNIPLLK